MIGCIIMASGLSVRYGKNKLLEKLGDREVILHTAGNLIAAGFAPLTVTRSVEVKALMEKEGLACALHDGPKRSDTMHVGLQNLDPDLSGYLFMPGDQPLVRPDSLRRMTAVFSDQKLLAYEGERGGAEVLKKEQIPCEIVQAAYEWELWDVDTPEMMEQVREIYKSRLKM